MCYNHTGDISTLDGTSLKLVDKFTYLGSSVSSTEKDIDTRLTKTWTATGELSIIWKSDLTDKMKRSFFQAVVVSILLYECTTWTLKKRLFFSFFFFFFFKLSYQIQIIFEQIYLCFWSDPNRYMHSWSEWTQWRLSIKEYFTLHRSSEQETYLQISFRVTLRKPYFEG